MEKRERRPSLPLRLFAELSNIFRLPNIRHRRASQQEEASGNQRSTNSTNTVHRSSNRPGTPAAARTPVASRTVKPTLKQTTPTSTAAQRPFSRSISTTVIHDVPRPQTPHTRRVKPSQLKPLQIRSSSLHVLQHTQAQEPILSNRNQPTSTQTAVSVDDLLATSANEALSSALLQPTRASLSIFDTSNVATFTLANAFNDIDPYATSTPTNHSVENSDSRVIISQAEVQPSSAQAESGSRVGNDRSLVNGASHSRSTPTLSTHPWYASTTSLNSVLGNTLSIAGHNLGKSEPPRTAGSRSVATAGIKSTNGNPVDTVVSMGSLNRLQVGERIVWFSTKDVAEFGAMKWIGTINGKEMAGIEFDNPIGNSSGKWNGKQLFNSSLTRGRFIPIDHLLLYSDYVQRLPFTAPMTLCPLVTSKDSEPTTFICVICQDSLLVSQNDTAGSTKTGDEDSVVATKCGHLFHKSCLKKWFAVKNTPRQPCPYCQMAASITEVIRIYPVQGK